MPGTHRELAAVSRATLIGPRMGVTRGVEIPTPFRFSGEVSCSLSRPLPKVAHAPWLTSFREQTIRLRVSESACTMRVCVRAYVFVRVCVCVRA